MGFRELLCARSSAPPTSYSPWKRSPSPPRGIITRAGKTRQRATPNPLFPHHTHQRGAPAPGRSSPSLVALELIGRDLGSPGACTRSRPRSFSGPRLGDGREFRPLRHCDAQPRGLCCRTSSAPSHRVDPRQFMSPPHFPPACTPPRRRGDCALRRRWSARRAGSPRGVDARLTSGMRGGPSTIPPRRTRGRRGEHRPCHSVQLPPPDTTPLHLLAVYWARTRWPHPRSLPASAPSHLAPVAAGG